jgi:DNA-binding response OmpR family regulator
MKILVVEDDVDLRAEIVGFLRRRSHEVVTSGSIAAAHEALQEMLADGQMPEAVICDVGLPDGDGVDFCVAAAASVPACRWLLLSGGHDFTRLESQLAGQAGLTHIIVEKPIHMELLQRFLEAPHRLTADG